MSKDLKWIEAIEKVLEEEKKPLHYTDIANLITEKGYREIPGATPANTVNVCLSGDIKENATNSKFVKVQMGTFTLKKYLDQINDEEEIQEEEKSKKIYKSIVQSFGISWNRNQVLWKNSPDLFGVQTLGATPVNFNKQIGVYLLHDVREIIYVGQAINQTISERLFQHTKNRLSGRWNRFSWFGLYSVAEDGKLNIINETNRTISIENIGDALEAILIESIEPRQNRKTGNKFYALEYNQGEDLEIQKKKNQELLEDLKAKL